VNWKLPIDATIEVADDAERILIGHAVVFFAGCNVTIVGVAPKKVRVTGSGYYAAVGA